MLNLNELEQKVLEFWENNNIFEKSVENRKECQPFVIFEGPPTANGRPGIHHVLTRTFKDMIARYQTMRGRFVERKAGWDEHGLPVEIEVQKELGLFTKKQIVEYGVRKFNEACASSTRKYVDEWVKLTTRMGYWLDFKNAYHTSDFSYIRKVWAILENMFANGLIYRSNKVVPWACDSGTVVSNAEVAQGYKTVKHISANVLFELCDGFGYLLAWTTTPWTLPANMALAVNSNFKYKKCNVDGKNIISLKVIGEQIGEIVGEELVGKEYFQPFTKKQCPVLNASFVKEEATGVVHIAPAFGADDYNLWAEQLKEPIVCHLNEDGIFNKPEWLSGHNVLADNFSVANKKVLSNLGDLVFSTENYEHEYPHNWRTGKPLIYYLRPSWYVNVNKFRDLLIKNNETVIWHPEHIKHGRFGSWLRGDVDWAISRERFWGTPLPFREGESVTLNHPHKPEADENGKVDVLDCWFDSGAMPFVAFENYKQADVICEAVDQTRGWFYSLLVIGTAMTGESPYKKVVCLGHILDKDGNKMSKTKGNVIDPWKMFEKYGADPVRWVLVSNPVGNSVIFSEETVKSVVKNFINRLWNCYTFFETYKTIEKPEIKEGNLQPIDCWILIRLQQLVNSSIYGYEGYKFSEVVTEIEKFVDDLSNVWIRANRSRFWNIDNIGTDEAAFYALHKVLTTLCRIIAPIMPFLAEHLWRNLSDNSVHLQDYPEQKEYSIELLDEMAKAKEIVSAGHKCRDEAKIKVRQLLRVVYVPSSLRLKFFEDFVINELNVKEIVYCDNEVVSLDTFLSEELLAAGFSRDFVRIVQVLRKQAGLQVVDRIILTIDWRDNKQLIDKNDVMKRLLVTEWLEEEVDNDVKIGNYVIGVKIAKC